jgi:Kelch motif
VVGDKIVVVGGRTGNPEQLVTQTEVYDGTRWRDADIPVPGDHLAVTADSSYVYAVGGRKFTAGSNTDVVQRYDPKANRWTALTPTPQPVSGAGAAIVDGRLIAGGEGVTTISATVKAYDLTASTATWTTLPLPHHGPPRPRGHRHRQHPLRRRRRHQSRTHRIHQPRRSTHLLVTAPPSTLERVMDNKHGELALELETLLDTESEELAALVLVQRLRAEQLDLDVDRGEPLTAGEAPEGAKGVELLALRGQVVQFVRQLEVLTSGAEREARARRRFLESRPSAPRNRTGSSSSRSPEMPP